MKNLNIYYETQLVGTVFNEENYIYFSYNHNFLESQERFPISLSLPLSKKQYSENEFLPFISNLLPEGESRLIITKTKHISLDNDLGLIAEIGKECAGALVIIPEIEIIGTDGFYKELTNEALDEILSSSIIKPLLFIDSELRLSLAGAQDKLPVYYDNDKIYLPMGFYASSHILKPEIRFLTHSVENEYFCMNLASKIGLQVSKVDIKDTGHNRILLVERYDRKLLNNKIVKLHQEDFCQANGISAKNKYENEGGISAIGCFQLVDKSFSTPVLAKKMLFEWFIFNFLIGNTDGHSKNISILYENNEIKLTPFYDLLSTIIYPELTDKMAFKIGGEKRHNCLRRRHFQRLGEVAGFKASYIDKIIDDICKKMEESLPEQINKFICKFGESQVIRKIENVIIESINHLKL